MHGPQYYSIVSFINIPDKDLLVFQNSLAVFGLVNVSRECSTLIFLFFKYASIAKQKNLKGSQSESRLELIAFAQAMLCSCCNLNKSVVESCSGTAFYSVLPERSMSVNFNETI